MYGDMETRMENAGRDALSTNVANRLDTVYPKSDWKGKAKSKNNTLDPL